MPRVGLPARRNPLKGSEERFAVHSFPLIFRTANGALRVRQDRQGALTQVLERTPFGRIALLLTLRGAGVWEQ